MTAIAPRDRIHRHRSRDIDERIGHNSIMPPPSLVGSLVKCNSWPDGTAAIGIA